MTLIMCGIILPWGVQVQGHKVQGNHVERMVADGVEGLDGDKEPEPDGRGQDDTHMILVLNHEWHLGSEMVLDKWELELILVPMLLVSMILPVFP